MNHRAMIKPKLLFAIALSAVLPAALTACGPAAAPPAEITGTAIDGAAIGGPFELVDKAGKPVKWDDFAGKYRIVYFGYTFCPDACPMDMGILMQGFAKFEKSHPDLAAKVQPIFITIDPERDTPSVLADFVPRFEAGIVGLTGTPDQIDRTADSFHPTFPK